MKNGNAARDRNGTIVRPPSEPPTSYAAFVRRYFPSIYRWCAQHSSDRDRAARAAQRIVLDLYRLEHDRLPVS